MIIYHVCCIGDLSNLLHIGQSDAVIFHSYDVNLTDNQISIYDKFYH